MAISRNPALLIANKPTTGLDVTTQKVVMNHRDCGRAGVSFLTTALEV
jgi:ABC-type dipeptide/oligopeptide/nickel transport system ATPase component